MRRGFVRSIAMSGVAVLVISTGAALAGPVRPAHTQVGAKWTHGTDSPFNAARFDGEFGVTKDRVYFLGFRTDADQTDGSVWYYDVASKTYADTGVDMPVPVSNYEIARLTNANGRIGLYIFGGRGADGVDVVTTQVYYPDTNSTADLKSDPWPGKTPMGCSDLPATGVAVLDNLAYVLGGISFADDGCADDNSAQTWIFDATAAKGHRWHKGPSMHVARGYITPAVLNGTIYAIGGDQIDVGSLIPIDTVESFTPAQGKWINKGVADLPEACDESQAFGFTKGPWTNGVVLAGCGQWPNALPDTLFYDVANNKWSIIGALNNSRRNFAGAVLPGKNPSIMVLGGYGEDSGFIDPINIAELGKGTTFALPGGTGGRSPARLAPLR
jgi:hypothetical protein